MIENSNLDKQNMQDILALTPTQEGILFDYLKDKKSKSYHLYLEIDMDGEVNLDIFQKAWNVVIENNDILRTMFRWERVKNPIQIILKEHTINVDYYYFDDMEEKERKKQVLYQSEKHKNEIFELQNIPYNISLYKLDKSKFRMIFAFHHILLDGWSNGIILKEFFNTYEQLIRGELPQVIVKTKFKEFVKNIHAKDKHAQEVFWREYLAGFDTLLEFSLVEKVHKKSGKINVINKKFPPEIWQQLDAFAKKHEVTLTAIIYTGWALLLRQYNNAEDVVFGTVVSGRPSDIKGIEDVAGLFINTLPLRVNSKGDDSILDIIKKVNQHLIHREEYSCTPLVDIKSCSGLKGSGELFDNILVVENYPLDMIAIKSNQSLKITEYTMSESTNYDLTVSIVCHNVPMVNYTYDDNLFEMEAILRLSEHYFNILNDLVSNPKAMNKDIGIIGKHEKDEILFKFNDTQASYPYNKTLHQIFEEQTELTPDHVAIIYKEDKLTYRQLNNRANQLAWYLRQTGVRPDTIVGIVMERSLEMMIGILGILKAGGAYMPIDPNYPSHRLKYLIKDSGISTIITVTAHHEKLNIDIKTVLLDDDASYAKCTDNLNILCNSNYLAYVIYTSGSTGNPKGVMIEHKAVVNRIHWMQKKYTLNHQDVILQKTTYMFDVSVWELFWWSFAGATLCFLEPDSEKDPRKMIEEIKRSRITTMHFVPSMLNVFLEYVETHHETNKLKSLRQVFASGEALLPKQVQKFNKLIYMHIGTRLTNLYGPTEAAIDVSYFDCTTNKKIEKIPIGKPIDNIRLFVMDKYLRLQPIGIPGELCIAGVGLAKGYINNHKLTAEKFIYIPFEQYISSSEKNAERMYKTGDLVRWLSNGNIEYLDRLDHQVKIRGFRIELGEIESNLLAYSEINEVAVTIKADSNKDKYIVAYIVSENDLDLKDIKIFLREKMPEYMIPSSFVRIPNLPLTSNGKLDRKALDKMKDVQSKDEYTYVKPNNEIEGRLVGIWKEVLGIKNVSVEDNFFDIGGNSLKIIRLVNKLVEAFNKEVAITTLFSYPTIRSLARFLTHDSLSKTISEDTMVLTKGKKISNSIAVIGMAGRFPGAKNIEEFWDNLKNEKESITFFSKEELREFGIDPNISNNPNYVKAKGVLENIECFDADFFSYTPNEAKMMDPQLRILHECAWEAMENAGYEPGSTKDQVGVYVGASSNFKWLHHISQQSKSPLEEFALFIHNEKDFFSTRLAYKLDCKGPAVTLQTACSTSMVSICTAYEDLRLEKCKIAIAGGIGIIYPQESGYLYYDGMVFSPDGHCKAFSKQANGTVPGNGVGIVVLKRLDEAINDGDTIYAVIKGAAVNNDGSRKIGYTAPSIEGQAEVIQAAMDRAGVKPEDISYIETHGTGTKLGDVVEIAALKQAFNTNKKNFCKIGSVKTNIGHVDSASGVAGFIKLVLSLKNKVIPASLHFNEPNPEIDFQNSPFEVNTHSTEWHNKNGVLRAGVSSFGIGGTNAHIILEEAPITESDEGKREWKIIPLSARTEIALLRMSDDLAKWLKKNPKSKLDDVAYTLQRGRKNYEYRKVVVCKDTQQAIEVLTTDSKKKSTFCSVNKNNKVVFMFSGIGSQYINMGLELYETESIFRQEMDYCLKIYKDKTNLDLKSIIYPNKENFEEATNLLENPEVNQPITFIFEYALAQLMIGWGITPQAMIGYSFGEYVAACISGVFSLEDALELVLFRGRLIEETQEGAMLSVPLTEKEIRPLLSEGLWVAISNGSSCIIAGKEKMISKFENEMKERRYVCIRLDGKHAIHSPIMLPVSKRLKEKIDTLKLNSPSIPYVSNVTGTWITVEDATNAEYWIKHLCSTVHFAKGMEEILKDSNSILVEIGANRDLCILAKNYVKDITQTPIINLIRNPQEKISDVFYLLNRVGNLWLNGKVPDWKNFYINEKRHRIMLPAYPFERKKYIQGDNVIGNNYETSAQKEKFQQVNGERKKIENWLYTEVWKQDSLQNQKTKVFKEKQRFLVFCDEIGVGERVIKKLEADGHQVMCVKPTSKYCELEKNKLYTIRPEIEEDYNVLFDTLTKSNKQPNQILHMWGIKFDCQKLDIQKVEETLEECYYSLLYIAKAIDSEETIKNIKINIITNDMHEITGDEESFPEKSVMIGPFNVLPTEYPQIKCKSIDVSLLTLDEHNINRSVQQIMIELSLEFKEDMVAYRGKYRWLKNFEECLCTRKNDMKLKKNGLYLITGGMGGMGMVLAEYLCRTFQSRLVLIGRSAFPERDEWEKWLNVHSDKDSVSIKIKKLKEMEKSGAKIFTYSCDIADCSKMEKIIEDVERRIGEVNGIIHAAGIADGCMIHRRTKQMSKDVFNSKIMGTLVLNHIFTNKELDFFILCSSISSILRTFGQVAYCAANAFENNFAYYWNRTHSSIATSIAWDTWLEVGMAIESVKHLKGVLSNSNREVNLINEGICQSEGIEIFKHVLATDKSQVLISIRELEYVIQESYNKGTTVSLESLQSASNSTSIEKNRIIINEYIEPISEVECIIVDVFKKYFGIEEIGTEDNFFDLGASSLDIIRINVRLKEFLNKEISVITMFKYPSVKLLAEFIMKDKQGDPLRIEEADRTEKIRTGKKNLNGRLQMKKR